MRIANGDKWGHRETTAVVAPARFSGGTSRRNNLISERVAVVVANADDASIGPHVGSAAADFELPDQEGKIWHLADHLARGPVVLVFYRGDW